MPELHRLVGQSEKGCCTLVLTDTDLTLECGPELREELRDAFNKTQREAEITPRFIGWFVDKVMHFAEHHIEEAFKPHSLSEVQLTLSDCFVTIKIGHIGYGTCLKVDPKEAYIFRAKFDQAKEALVHH